MDHSVEIELSKLDPSIPFRASTTHLHSTWAKTLYSRPELYICPQSLEEIQKTVTLARRCRRRLVVVGCGHSPSDLTCTSAWMMNLDEYNKILSIDKEKGVVIMQSGIRLYTLGDEMKKVGLMMPNLGSIDNQSIAGAFATATHGSSTRHGLLSQSVLALRIMLANGRIVSCSADQNVDLFRAALVSLGAIGVITQVTYQMVPNFNIEWEQSLQPLQRVLDQWNGELWTQAEFVRVWWWPYGQKAVVWKAAKTSKDERPVESNWYGSTVGFHTYHIMLYLAQWIPRLLPAIEWYVVGMQFGFKVGTTKTAVQEGRTGLLMDCLYSQRVNEWAIPLEKGPEVISRISNWLQNEQESSGIPFDPKGVFVHAPIEVRVSDTTPTTPRPFLDNTTADGPTLYLNFTLYRPFNRDPPALERYYEAVEWLMKEMGGRPHWAKNFTTVSKEEFRKMYGENLDHWLRVRDDVDPEGMFVGDWHRRNLLPDTLPTLALEEKEQKRENASGGGENWFGKSASKPPSSKGSEESFDLVHGAEAESLTLLPKQESTLHGRNELNTVAVSEDEEEEL
ncbi:MAG: D-arabinono-1,4-lactone oxidase [Candelina submexicana]|nr:MAG: D-arabinono-1,4-lactone oxidase [Candelina submexicana]